MQYIERDRLRRSLKSAEFIGKVLFYLVGVPVLLFLLLLVSGGDENFLPALFVYGVCSGVLAEIHELLHKVAARRLGYSAEVRKNETLWWPRPKIIFVDSGRILKLYPLRDHVIICLAPQILTVALVALSGIVYLLGHHVIAKFVLLLVLSNVMGSAEDICKAAAAARYIAKGVKYVLLT